MVYLGPLRRGRAHHGLRGAATWKPYNPYPPLPRSTVRDLLGITGALYRVTLAEDSKDVVKLQALTAIGKGFRRALEKCTGHTGTIPYMEG